jgi:hypothetical protein
MAATLQGTTLMLALEARLKEVVQRRSNQGKTKARQGLIAATTSLEASKTLVQVILTQGQARTKHPPALAPTATATMKATATAMEAATATTMTTTVTRATTMVMTWVDLARESTLEQAMNLAAGMTKNHPQTPGLELDQAKAAAKEAQTQALIPVMALAQTTTATRRMLAAPTQIKALLPAAYQEAARATRRAQAATKTAAPVLSQAATTALETMETPTQARAFLPGTPQTAVRPACPALEAVKTEAPTPTQAMAATQET